MYMSENVNYSLHCQHIDMSTSRISDSEHHQSTMDLKLVISWTNESHWKGHTRSPPAVEPPLTGKRSFCLQTDEIGNMCQPEIHINHLSRHHTYLICILYENPRTHALTLPMDSAMDSTMPPTMPPSLAASFNVTMMSSTASFISWEASEMASWVWNAWGHSWLINGSVTLSWFSQKEIYQCCCRVSLQLVLSVSLEDTSPDITPGCILGQFCTTVFSNNSTV